MQLTRPVKPRLEVDPAGRDTPVALDTTTWRIGSSHRLTVIAKATIQLVASGLGPSLPPEPLALGSVELAPVLPHPQITLVGHAYTPSGTRRGMQPVRIALERGGAALFEKSILVYGDRQSPTDFAQPFDAMPLVHERAPGGGWNPVGRVIARGDPPPNLVPVSPNQPIACFAPIPADFPARAGIYDPAALRLDDDGLGFGLFDFRWFQDAPFDQWVARLEGDETLIVEGLSPHVPRLATDLPRGLVRATWWYGRAQSGRVRLRLDRIDVDVDRGLASLVWRGHFALPAGASPGDLAIRVTMGGASLADLLDDVAIVDAPIGESRAGLAVASPPNDPSAASPGSVAAALAAMARAPLAKAAKADLDTTARLKPLTDEDIARARNPMPFRAAADPVAGLLDGSLTGDALRAADLTGAALKNADLKGRDLRGARLTRADLRGAQLAGARLDGCDLEGSSLRGADLSAASLEGARLSNADLSRASLRGARLAGARLRAAIATEAKLDEADLEKTDLDDLDAVGASFAGAVLRGATLCRARCDRASFRGAVLDGADLREASLVSADLRDATCDATRFDRTDLGGADLAGTRLGPDALATARTTGLKRS